MPDTLGKPIMNFFASVSGQRKTETLVNIKDRIAELGSTSDLILAAEIEHHRAVLDNNTENFQQLDKNFGAHTQFLAERLDGESDRTRSYLDEILNKLRTDVCNLIDNHEGQSKAFMQHACAEIELLSRIQIQLGENRSAVKDDIERLTWDLRDALSRQMQHGAKQSESLQRSLAIQIDGRLCELIERAADTADSVRDANKQHIEFSKQLAAKADEARKNELRQRKADHKWVASELTTIVGALEKTGASAAKHVSSRIDETRSQLDMRLENVAATLTFSIEQRTSLLGEMQEKHLDLLIAADEKSSASLLKKLDQNANELDAAIRKIGENIVTSNTKGSEKLISAVNRAAADSHRTHAEFASSLKDSVDGTAEMVSLAATKLENNNQILLDLNRTSLEQRGDIVRELARLSDRISTGMEFSESAAKEVSKQIIEAESALVEQVEAFKALSANLTKLLTEELTGLREEIARFKDKSAQQSAAITNQVRDIWEAETQRRKAEAKKAELAEGSLSLAPAIRPPSTLDLFPSDYKLRDFDDGKIAIFGLQKAGNTWLLSLLADIFELPAFFNVHDEGQLGIRAVVSTHDPLDANIRSRKDFVHGVCLVRDIRDIITSYYHYMQTSAYKGDVPKAAYEDIETFYYDWFLTRMVPAYRFHTFWEEYAEAGLPVLRYERMIDDTVGELDRLFRRWGERMPKKKIQNAVSEHSFDMLKRQGRKIGETVIDSSHFRRGVSGSYRDELPEAIINDINQRFRPVLERWGYEI